MGFLDKLKDAAQSILSEGNSSDGATYLEDMRSDGTIEGESLPKTDELIHFSLDMDKEKIFAYQHVSGTFKSKDKLIAEIPLDSIVEYRMIEKEREDDDVLVIFTYKSEIVCESGEKYILDQSWSHMTRESRYNIEREMEKVIALNGVLLWFIDTVTDDATKQRINEIYAERGVELPFDENGNIDMDRHLQNHSAWFQSQMADWKSRLAALE